MQPSDSTDPQPNVSAESQDETNEISEPSGPRKFLAPAVALVITAGALWFLFGIPAYLLFGVLFE